MAKIFLGIDGGGTGCRAALANPAGVVIGRGTSGPANIVSDLDAACRHLLEAATSALRDAGLPHHPLSAIPAVLGLAGATVPASAAALRARLPIETFELVSDGRIALEGAFAGGDGSVAILGTGTYFLCRAGGRIHTIGGWGFLVGDAGSGARIGQAALQETILTLDGIRTPTPLCDAIADIFGHDPARMVAFAQDAKPADFARHAPDVFTYAQAGDAKALRIMTHAAHQVDEALDRLSVLGGSGLPLALLGGLSAFYPPFLAARHRHFLQAPKGDALDGALRLARQLSNGQAGEAA